MRPVLACSAPVRRLNIVLLPAPLGPIRPRISPALRSKFTLLTAISPPNVRTASSTFKDQRAALGQRATRHRLGFRRRRARALGQAFGNKGNQAAAGVLQQQDQEDAEGDDLELGGVVRHQRQHILQPVLQQRDQRRAGNGACDMAGAARHRHQQIFDAGLDVERGRADEPVHVRIEPAGQSRQQCGEHEGDEADAEDVDAEARQQHAAAAQAPDRAAFAGIEQIGARQHGEADHEPDQIVDRSAMRSAPPFRS